MFLNKKKVINFVSLCHLIKHSFWDFGHNCDFSDHRKPDCNCLYGVIAKRRVLKEKRIIMWHLVELSICGISSRLRLWQQSLTEDQRREWLPTSRHSLWVNFFHIFNSVRSNLKIDLHTVTTTFKSAGERNLWGKSLIALPHIILAFSPFFL